jgi:hypothetical protein
MLSEKKSSENEVGYFMLVAGYKKERPADISPLRWNGMLLYFNTRVKEMESEKS